MGQARDRSFGGTVLMEERLGPGWYEIVDVQPDAGAVQFAAQWAARYPLVLWISTPAKIDDWSIVAPLLQGHCTSALLQIEKVSVAMAVIRDVQTCSDCVVLDDLATLLPDHPSATRIAPDVRRCIAGWTPQIPILVVNQWRRPAPPGGAQWRAALKKRWLVSQEGIRDDKENCS